MNKRPGFGRGVFVWRLVGHQLHALGFEHGEHAREIVPTPQDPAIHSLHAERALPARILGSFLDLVEWRLTGAAIDAEEGAVGQGVPRDGSWAFPVYFGYARKEAPDPILVDKRSGAASWAGLEAHRAFMEKMKRR